MIKASIRGTNEIILPERQAEVGEWAQHENGMFKEYHPAPEAVELIPIVVTGITGAISHADDFSTVAVYTDETVTVTGTLAVTDSTFYMSLSRNGVIAGLFLAEVVDGEFSVKVKLGVTGQYTYSSTEANLDLDVPMFSVNSTRIDVIEDLR